MDEILMRQFGRLTGRNEGMGKKGIGKFILNNHYDILDRFEWNNSSTYNSLLQKFVLLLFFT